MATVALLGFSGAGKSTILRQVEAAVKSGRTRPVRCVDTDSEVSRPDGGHIYDVYISHGLLAAKHLIATRERALLQREMPSAEPRLIAAGPFLPSREPEWGAFVERIHPRFLYLEHDATAVLRALKFRREKHEGIPELVAHRQFGSWDAGIRTQRQNDGTFRLLDDESALLNIADSMRGVVPIYERLAGPNRVPAIAGEDDPALPAVIEQVVGLLEL